MRISGLLDPRKGRGFFNTFHASYFFMRWPLDHLFHSNEFSVKRIERLAKYGSDHFALLTELVYNPDSDNQKQQAQIDKEKAVDELKMPSASKQQCLIPTRNNTIILIKPVANKNFSKYSFNLKMDN